MGNNCRTELQTDFHLVALVCVHVNRCVCVYWRPEKYIFICSDTAQPLNFVPYLSLHLVGWLVHSCHLNRRYGTIKRKCRENCIQNENKKKWNILHTSSLNSKRQKSEKLKVFPSLEINSFFFALFNIVEQNTELRGVLFHIVWSKMDAKRRKKLVL